MTASNSIHTVLIFIVITLVQVVACNVLKVQVIFALYIVFPMCKSMHEENACKTDHDTCIAYPVNLSCFGVYNLF